MCDRVCTGILFEVYFDWSLIEYAPEFLNCVQLGLDFLLAAKFK